MKGLMAVGLMLALGVVSASDAFAADGRSGGGPAVERAGGPGARYGGAPAGGSHGGAYAVPRGAGGGAYAPPTGAQYRHPRAGTGTGGYYYGHGHGHYPYYGRYPYYGYYPYWGYYSYPGYGLPGLGLSFYFSDAYATPYYSAPYYVGPPAASVGYYGGGYGGGYYGGGGGYESAPAPAPADAAELRLEIVPEDASVWIDDEFRGVARDLARLALPPGRHRVEVVRPGFRTAAEEVDLRPGTATALRIELERP